MSRPRPAMGASRAWIVPRAYPIVRAVRIVLTAGAGVAAAAPVLDRGSPRPAAFVYGSRT